MPTPPETPEPKLVRFIFEEPLTSVEVSALSLGDAGSITIIFESGEIEAASIAALVSSIDEWLAAGKGVRLIEAPQMLAHTLYKLGRLKQKSLTVSSRNEEPYAG
jgi:hypothetical protein